MNVLWNFDDDSGINMNALFDCKSCSDFYELFLNDDVLN